MSLRYPREFLEWLLKDQPGESTAVSLGSLDIAEIADPERAKRQKDALLIRVRDDPSINATMDVRGQMDVGSILDRAKGNIRSLNLRDGDYSIRNARVRSMTLSGNSCSVSFENVEIGELSIQVATSLRLSDTKINVLRPIGRCVTKLYWNGGYIGQIRCGIENPFVGDVQFHRVYVCRDSSRTDIQALRDTRAKLSERGNNRAAGLFHAAELAAMRKTEPWGVARAVSWLYDFGSNYGNSVGRPFAILLASLILIFCFSFATNLVQPSSYSLLAAGWHRELAEGGLRARTLTSAVYSFQSVVNPLNLFSSQPLTIAKDALFAGICSLIGFVGILALALFALSVRRRFKLEGDPAKGS